MSELFNNYLSTGALSAGSNIPVVPYAIAGLNTLVSGSLRPVNTSAQIHSILISQMENSATFKNGHMKCLADGVSNTYVEAESVFFNLILFNRTSDGTEKAYTILTDCMVPYQNAFYLEKTITLLPSQRLAINFIQDAGKNRSARTYTCVVSSADIS